MAKVEISGKVYEYDYGTSFEQIARDVQADYDSTIILCVANGKIRELHRNVEGDCKLSMITLKDSAGHKTYERSATMIFVKALCDVIGDPIKGKAKVEFAIGKGIYISAKGDYKVDSELASAVEERMRDIVAKDIPIVKKNYPIDEAVRIFDKLGMTDKVKLFKYRQSSTVNVYSIEDYSDYYYGYMAPSTGYIKYFEVFPYQDGFILLLPDKNTPDKIDVFEPLDKLYNALDMSTKWSNQLSIDTVGDLNNMIVGGDMERMILLQEALQERRIGEIAAEIASRKDVKFIMIAGPSSSGKTSLSYRLSIQLATLGLVPHPIALDNYFVDREKTPRDENGDYNFECLEALDVEQFNKDMLELLDGKEVSMPTFNFKTGKREYKGNTLKLNPDDVLVIEGIHGLNQKMSYALPEKSKYKIYISALTSLNIDGHNRIPTTDGRLLRRMVRDARTRGAGAKRTIQMWASVRRGEEENIFPFQEGADAFFNSASIYELAALKQYAEPLLYQIGEDEPEYHEAKRLLKFLEYFLGVSTENLPNNSIVREFVGGSCFPV